MVVGTITRSRLMDFASKRDKNWKPGAIRRPSAELDELELDREQTSLISKRQSGLMNFTHLEKT
jgi:hypothetical protein